MKNKTKNEKFVQIPNQMFAWNTKYKVNNDELTLYVLLKASMHIREFDLDDNVTKTNLMLLADLCGFEVGQESKNKKRVFKALDSLREKGYIDFDKSVTSKQNRMFSVKIKNYNFKDVVEVDASWSQTKREISGFTKINYSVIDKLLENKDMLLYSYAEYRYMPELNYRICIDEWVAVLEVSRMTVVKNINDSEAIIKINNGYNTEKQKQETNSYLPFNRSSDVEQMEEKEVFRNSKSIVKEQEFELVEDDFDIFEEEEISLKAEAKKPIVEAHIKPTKATKQKDNKVVDIHTKQAKIDSKDFLNQIKGNTLEENTFKKMQREDKRVTTLDESKQIQDFDVPMSISMFNVIKTTDSAYIRNCGANKLKSTKFKKKFGAKLEEDIDKDAKLEYKIKFTSQYLYNTITEYYVDGGECVISSDKLYDYVHNRMVYSDDEYTYFTPTNMVPHLKCIKVTEKY